MCVCLRVRACVCVLARVVVTVTVVIVTLLDFVLLSSAVDPVIQTDRAVCVMCLRVRACPRGMSGQVSWAHFDELRCRGSRKQWSALWMYIVARSRAHTAAALLVDGVSALHTHFPALLFPVFSVVLALNFLTVRGPSTQPEAVSSVTLATACPTVACAPPPHRVRPWAVSSLEHPCEAAVSYFGDACGVGPTTRGDWCVAHCPCVEEGRVHLLVATRLFAQSVIPVTGPYLWVNCSFVAFWLLSWVWFLAATFNDPGFYVSDDGRSLPPQSVTLHEAYLQV